ncbi:MAG: hypothetical protein ABW166_04705 [Sedimenticola sp.]
MKIVKKGEFFEFIKIFEESNPKMEIKNLNDDVTIYLGGSGLTTKAVALHLPETREYIYILDSEFA